MGINLLGGNQLFQDFLRGIRNNGARPENEGYAFLGKKIVILFWDNPTSYYQNIFPPDLFECFH